MSKKAFLSLILLILGFQSFLIACGGNCLECHSKLRPYINDQNHVVLNECITCHDKPAKNGQCGGDCFDCHTREKVYAQKDVSAHQELKTCGACHKEKVDFTTLKRSPSSNPQTIIQLFK